jgi:acyl-coenzyme A synthetase/AMP-(fatty) acid ligase/acyl carrier protein
MVVVNGYGPTETTTFAVCHRMEDVPDAAATRLPIGRPISNTRAYILDAFGQPVPVGIPGELYIGGLGVARGYHDRPDLTAERFLPDPFSSDASARMYRTGDRCRWHDNGTIDFLGRLDDQIKIRGFRIEPGEVEAALLGHEAVREALALAMPDNSGENALVAFVTPRVTGAVSEERLRNFLVDKLPAYLIPDELVILETFPRTRNDKIDRAALDNPLRNARSDERKSTAPESSVEKDVAGIWSEVLGLSEIKLDDDFFRLGGHSLLAMRVVSRFEERFGIPIAIRAVFEHSTLRSISQFIARTQDSTGTSTDYGEVTEVTI